MIKGLIHEEGFSFINIYASNIGTSKYTKQILTDVKGETDSNIIIVGDFNTSLTFMDRSFGQKISKATEILNNIIVIYLIHFLQILQLKKPEYTFFSSAHETCSRIDHILGHKTSLDKFKRIEIISSIFSNHNCMELEINHRKENWKRTNTWRPNMLLKKPMDQQ